MRLDQGHSVMIPMILYVHLITTLTDAASVTLLSMPAEPGPSWSWQSEGGGWTGGLGKSYQRTCHNSDLSSRPNNWLMSPTINIAEARTIFVSINYTMRKCSDENKKFCRENVTLYAYQVTNYMSTCPGAKNGEYKKTATITAANLWTSSDTNRALNIGTWTLTIKPNTVYVCLAVHDQGACVKLLSFVVMYKFCPPFTNPTTLVHLPKTVAPRNESHALIVNGSCSEVGADPSSTGIYGYCESSGEWNISSQKGECLCKPGFGNLNSKCQVCSAGSYKARQGNSICSTCPENSYSKKGATRCNCTAGAYRAPIENFTHNCTGPPSEVEDVRVTFQNETTAIIKWKPPAETGGRTDLLYDIQCSECGWKTENCTSECSSVSFRSGKLNLATTRAVLERLNRTVSYKIQIRPKNGVSGLAGQRPNWSDAVTVYSVPSPPKVTVTDQNEKTVVIEWSLANDRDQIDHWIVSYKTSKDMTAETGIEYLDGRVNKHTRIYTFEDLHANTVYTFQVQGNNSRGLGMVGKATGQIEASRSKTDKRTAGGINKNTIIVAVTVAGVLFILIIALTLLLMLQRRTSARDQADNRIFQGNEMASRGQYIDPNDYDNPLDLLKDFTSEINRNNVKLEDVIGEGEFANVYRGSLKTSEGQIIVAIKVLKQGATPKNKDDFLFEASIMGQFHHPNVIRLEGIVTKTRPMMIVTEFMENGSLLDFLKAHYKLLTQIQLIGMARGVAFGMAYLSEMNFIHRDLAARNVLVGENMICKVADFGLSRELSDDSQSEYQTQGGKIAIRWTAPEALHHRTFCSASDVWSFGIVLWEIMSFGERPYWDWNNFQVMERVRVGYHLPSPPNCPRVIHDIMVECWDQDKTKRPKFAEIVKSLDVFIRSPEQLRRSIIHPIRSASPDYSKITTVQEWLESIKMGSYLELFQNAGYMELHDVVKLEKQDLHRIGITLIGHKNKISKSIKRIHLDFNNLAYEAC